MSKMKSKSIDTSLRQSSAYLTSHFLGAADAGGGTPELDDPDPEPWVEEEDEAGNCSFDSSSLNGDDGLVSSWLSNGSRSFSSPFKPFLVPSGTIES